MARASRPARSPVGNESRRNRRCRGATVPTVLVVLAASALLAAVPAAAVEIALADPRPLLGEPVAVTVTEGAEPLAGARLEAHYRPNSQTAFRETLPPTDATGRTDWTPSAAGIATLEVLDPAGGPPLATLNTAVRYGRFPARGIVVMVVAGVLLFGGAALGMKMLLSEGPPAVEPPST